MNTPSHKFCLVPPLSDRSYATASQAFCHVHGKSGYTSETVKDKDVTHYYTPLIGTNRMTPLRMTLRDLQRDLRIANFFKCDFSCRCAAVRKILTDRAPRGPYPIAELHIITCNRLSWLRVSF